LLVLDAVGRSLLAGVRDLPRDTPRGRALGDPGKLLTLTPGGTMTWLEVGRPWPCTSVRRCAGGVGLGTRGGTNRPAGVAACWDPESARYEAPRAAPGLSVLLTAKSKEAAPPGVPTPVSKPSMMSLAYETMFSSMSGAGLKSSESVAI
jgi:hypothetical protein